MSSPPRRLPVQSGSLPRSVTSLLGLAALVVSAAGLKAFSGTLGPAFLTLVLMITVQPLQTALRRRGMPGWIGVVAVLLTVYAILVALAAALALSVAKLATLLPTYQPQFNDLVHRVTTWLQDNGVDQKQLSALVDQFDLSKLVGLVQPVIGGVSSVVSGLGLIIVLLFFLAIDTTHFSRRLDATADSHPGVVRALRGFAHGTRRWVAVTTIFGLIVAVLDAGALYWLQVPLPLLWGLLSFITNYIANIGFVVGLTPPALLALLEHGIVRMVLVVVAYSVINVVLQSFVQPKIVGDAVGLSVTLSFMSLVFWGYLLGALGALLAIPLTLLVKALLVDSDPDSQWLRPLLGDVRQEHASSASTEKGKAAPQGAETPP